MHAVIPHKFRYFSFPLSAFSFQFFSFQFFSFSVFQLFKRRGHHV